MAWLSGELPWIHAVLVVLEGRVHAPNPDDDADRVAISLHRHGVYRCLAFLSPRPPPPLSPRRRCTFLEQQKGLVCQFPGSGKKVANRELAKARMCPASSLAVSGTPLFFRCDTLAWWRLRELLTTEAQGACQHRPPRGHPLATQSTPRPGHWSPVSGSASMTFPSTHTSAPAGFSLSDEGCRPMGCIISAWQRKECHRPRRICSLFPVRTALCIPAMHSSSLSRSLFLSLHSPRCRWCSSTPSLNNRIFQPPPCQ